MRRKKVVVGMAVLSLMLGGCALPRPERMAESTVKLEVVPTQVASVSEARVEQRGEELVISGTVRKYHRFYLPSHVDVVVCGPDGKMLGQVQQRLTGGYFTSRGGEKEVRFTARLSLTPPAGSTVRVRYHAPSSGEEHLKCA